MDCNEWLALADEVVSTFESLRRAVPLRSDHEDQQHAMALVSWDLGAFLQGQMTLARNEQWSPAYSLGRLIAERGEHLIALHHDRNFAKRFMAATRAIGSEGANGASRRVTDARGVVRRFVSEELGDDAAAQRYLKE